MHIFTYSPSLFIFYFIAIHTIEGWNSTTFIFSLPTSSRFFFLHFCVVKLSQIITATYYTQKSQNVNFFHEFLKEIFSHCLSFTFDNWSITKIIEKIPIATQSIEIYFKSALNFSQLHTEYFSLLSPKRISQSFWYCSRAWLI